MKDQPPRLVIKENSVAVNDPCELCGARTDPELGPELYLDGTWALVCYECGEKYAPELVSILRKERRDAWERYVAEMQNERS